MSSTKPALVLPVVLNNSALPQVPYSTTYRPAEFETGVTDHWLFDSGNTDCLTGVNGGVLAPNNGTGATGVGAIAVTDGGSSYASAPTVSFSGGGGSGATAVAVVDGGAVIAVHVTANGTGYTSAPTVSFSGGSGSGAAATATLGGAPFFRGAVADTPPSSGAYMGLAGAEKNGLLSPYDEAATVTQWAVFRKDSIISGGFNVPIFGTISSSDNTTGHLTYLAGGVFDQARIGGGSSSVSTQLASTATPPVSTTWLFVAVAQAPSSRSVFVGNVGTQTDTADRKTSTRKIAVGNAYFTNAQWYQGARLGEYGLLLGEQLGQTDLDAIYARAKVRMARRGITLY